MKTKLSLLFIITFVIISLIIIYKEASARPMLCDTIEENCGWCGGDFELIYCEGDPLIYCEFACYFDLPPEYFYPFPCPWPFGPVYGTCVQ